MEEKRYKRRVSLGRNNKLKNKDMLNKLTNPFCIQTAVIVIFLTMAPSRAKAQDSAVQVPSVIRSIDIYKAQVKADPGKEMVQLEKMIPELVYDLRYASANNFMKRQMYRPAPSSSFLRIAAAEALAKAQQELSRKGLGIKIFDAYRPYSVTVEFWELVKDERYVANPAKGSGHNRGIAVDLTLIRLSDKTELPMGTGFDNFSDTAHHSFTALPADVLSNRQMLRSTLEKYGFKALETEWWHYFLPDGNRFEILDIPFKQLGKAF